MAVIKTWFTAYIIHAALYLFFPDGVGMALIVAIFSFIGSLFAIPLLIVFWSLFSSEAYHKAYIITWSCIAAIVIAVITSLGTIGFLTHSLRLDTLSEYAMFIGLPGLAAILSILINHKGIYQYTQGHLLNTEIELDAAKN